MATVQEEYSKIQTGGNRPLPGQSLANDPENPAPFEKAPEFTSVHAASEYLWESFIEPETYVSLMGSVSDGVPIMDIAQIILFTEFQKGSWNPDLMLMLFEPVAYMIMALAERAELEMTIYEGDLEDDDEEEDFAGTQIEENRIQKIIKDGTSGRIPEGVLTAEMQKSLETLPELDAPDEPTAQPSLMQAPVQQEPAPNTQSLMAPPQGV
jgi:hypothetical protein|tara:strand:+ start:757 stop:1386 length:630 start_codon:yes stop_codon:yes gene_type:complete